jgi:hypothetical protein
MVQSVNNSSAAGRTQPEETTTLDGVCKGTKLAIVKMLKTFAQKKEELLTNIYQLLVPNQW